MRSRLIALGAAAVAAQILGFLFLTGTGAEAPARRSDAQSAEGSAPSGASARPRATPDAVDASGASGDPAASDLPLPASLRGTTVDGGFDVDADGRFLPTEGAVRLFDYFLATLGELTLDGIRARIRAEARATLPESEVEAVMALFERYLRYQERSAAIAEGARSDGSLLAHFEALVALQVEMFGAADAARMFGRRNAVSEVALRRMAVRSDESLTPEAREEALTSLEATLPEDLREARARMGAPARARDEVEALRASGASEDEVFAVRARHFGQAAATRLAALDDSRTRWNARIAAYRAERDALLARNAPEAALAELRAQHFEGPEALRVAALDRMEIAP